MQQAKVNIFGIKGELNSAQPGETIVSLRLNDDGLYDAGTFFLVSGSVKITGASTGYEFPSRQKGRLVSLPEHAPLTAPAGESRIRLTFPEPCVWLCITHNLNPNMPPLEPLLLQDGETAPLVSGDRLFVFTGSLSVAETTFGPGSAVECGVDQATATAVGEVVALKIL